MGLEHFSGTWVFDKDESELNSQPPLRWIQRISITDDRICVQEEITRTTEVTIVEVDAIPNGDFYPVKGSPIADEISYVVQGSSIQGVARKAGVVSLRETLSVSDLGQMSMNLTLLINGKEIPLGVARFRKDQTA